MFAHVFAVRSKKIIVIKLRNKEVHLDICLQYINRMMDSSARARRSAISIFSALTVPFSFGFISSIDFPMIRSVLV